MTAATQLTRQISPFRFFLVALVFATCTGSYAAAQDKLRPAADIPTPGEFDRWDYNVYFALPARITYVLQERDLNGNLVGAYEHDDYESALAQQDFLETRMMLDYRIVEVRQPQRWFFDGRYDTYTQAWAAAMNLRDAGLDYDIREVTDWEFTRR